jgi:hypothetical protein
MGLFSNNFREEYDYLLLKQPKPSSAVLENDTFLKYTRSDCASSSCFTWIQPLTFVVDEKHSQWNELSLNSQSFSEILQNVKNSNCLTCEPDINHCFCFDDSMTECDIVDSCKPFKYSLTASNIKSDINLYTDFWEKTTEVYYFSQNNFQLSADLKYLGISEDALSAKYTNNDNLFTNLGNDNFTQSVAWFANKNDLVSKDELGFFLPDVYHYGKWDHTLSDKPKVQSTNNRSGNLFKDHKEYVEVFDISNIKNDYSGIGFSTKCAFDCFDVEKDLIHLNNCQTNTISSYEINRYQEDIFGNRYYLYKDHTLLNTIHYKNNANTGNILVNTVNGQWSDIATLFFDNVFFDDFSNITGLVDAIRNDEISQIEIFYDTLIIRAYDHFGIFQIYMNYETGTPYIVPDNSYCFTGTNLAYTLDRASKQIYFVYKNSPIINVGVYDLNSNNIFIDYDNHENTENLLGATSCFNAVTRELYYINIVSFPSTTQRGISTIKYQKVNNRFVYKESVLIERFSGVGTTTEFSYSMVDEQGIVTLIRTSSNINVIKYHV